MELRPRAREEVREMQDNHGHEITCCVFCSHPTGGTMRVGREDWTVCAKCTQLARQANANVTKGASMSTTETKVRHTPWVWQAEPHPVINGHTGYIVYGDSAVICEIFTRSDYPIAVNESNARLIAAAPDMLEALEGLLAASDWEPSEPLTSEAIHRIAAAQGKAQNAIARAKGGAA